MAKLQVILACVVLSSVALAGCLSEGKLALDPLPELGNVLSIDTAQPLQEQALFWKGPTLSAGEYPTSVRPIWDWYTCWITGTCPSFPEPKCEPDNCQRIPFELELPEDFWDIHTGHLEVSLRYISIDDEGRGFALRILDADGRKVAEGMDGGEGIVALVPQAPAGTYVAEIIITYGEGPYDGVIQVDAVPRDEEVHDMLPNLVTLPPTDLHIGQTNTVGCFILLCVPNPASGAMQNAAGGRGCYLDEYAEKGARKCLRFANRVGNVGEGPLEVRLKTTEAVKAFGAMGQHMQRVHRSDGTFTDRAAGAAHFHATHEHFHYMNLVEFRLHEFDVATETRGAQLGSAQKSGICLVDIGLVALGLPYTSEPNWDITCFYPMWSDENTEWHMSLSPNWFDLYTAYTNENYVDVSKVPDGVYELVATTNVDDSVLESDTTDNEGSVVFRLTGDKVEVLQEREGAHWNQHGA